ncbi:hypothetical protein [Vogesella mureinivorans]|uniref:hypothetical protein n=1 Tax=Vogesella mureinivorans TaxID=657276 RepID=UPI0011CA8F7B|nr:hypothetical protein [Vogesella mureinivorans]
MIQFEQAIDVALSNAKNLLKQAYNFTLEGVIISSDEKYLEVTLSYELHGSDPLAISPEKANGLSAMAQLAQIMGRRREYKVFLVDSGSGVFKGFKMYRDK